MTGAAELADLLVHGELEVEGRLVHASNTTLYARLTLDGQSAGCVYKPVAGERPLWDFPDGTLAGREVAAYLLSTATGWDIVPPTVLRDGPFGPGMCQLWVDIDEEAPSLVDVLGHTDSTGSEASNKALSERRAQAVAAHLKSRGVATARIATRGYGASFPIADNATEQGRATNRRVEIKVVPLR